MRQRFWTAFDAVAEAADRADELAHEHPVISAVVLVVALVALAALLPTDDYGDRVRALGGH